MDRFGPKIGASRIGATVYELPPGQALCPYHYETDEEWLLVLEGELTVRHPDGDDVLEAGDVTALPGRPRGRAQDRSTRATETVRFMMLSTKRRAGVRVYPDSNKIGIWTGRREERARARRAGREPRLLRRRDC